MTAAVLIPAGVAADEWRARALDYVQAWWARHFPQLPVHLGDSGDPWSKGAAVDAALELADGAQVLILADADSFLFDPVDVRRALELADGGEPWIVPHRLVYRLRERETVRLQAEPDTKPRLGWTHRPAYEGPAGGGITIVRRDAFELVGGIDRRYLGWGGEDLSFGWALETLAGPVHRLDGALVHLWHPHPAPTLRGSPESEELVARYKSARGVPRRMRAIVAGEQWAPAEPLPEPVTFRMHANRQTVRLPSGEIAHFPGGTFTTSDPDTVEQLRCFPIVAEERRR